MITTLVATLLAVLALGAVQAFLHSQGLFGVEEAVVRIFIDGEGDRVEAWIYLPLIVLVSIFSLCGGEPVDHEAWDAWKRSAGLSS